MKKNILKRAGAAVLTTALLFSLTACNTKIKVEYDVKATDYVKLGQYKELIAEVDTESIENNLIEKKIMNDVADNTTYVEVDREAKEGDMVKVDMTATIGGETVQGFSNEDYEVLLGKDTFIIDGFIDALYGMKTGEVKIVTLTVPTDFEDAAEYAGKRIVYQITMKAVGQPNVPMVTDAYVKEKFAMNTVADYRQSVKEELQETIDEQINEAKKEAVLTQLQDNSEVTGYPEEYMNTKREELNSSIKFYAIMQDKSNDEYCQEKFNMSFDEYVKRSVAQDLIFQAIIETEKLEVTEYEYKGELQSFAESMGYTNKDTFLEKYGKEKIVKAMLVQKAQDIIMDSAVYK